MLNLKKNENDAVFDKICKKKAKIKIKLQKKKGTFLDSIHWLKSHQPRLVHIYLGCFRCFVSSMILILLKGRG